MPKSYIQPCIWHCVSETFRGDILKGVGKFQDSLLLNKNTCKAVTEDIHVVLNYSNVAALHHMHCFCWYARAISVGYFGRLNESSVVLNSLKTLSSVGRWIASCHLSFADQRAKRQIKGYFGTQIRTIRKV